MATVDPVAATAAIVALATAVGTEVAKRAGGRVADLVEGSAAAAFGKVKSLLALKSNANSPELKKEVEAALAAKPEAVAELQKIIPPAYWQNAGTVNMYVEKGSAIGQNSGTQTNNFN